MLRQNAGGKHHLLARIIQRQEIVLKKRKSEHALAVLFFAEEAMLNGLHLLEFEIAYLERIDPDHLGPLLSLPAWVGKPRMSHDRHAQFLHQFRRHQSLRSGSSVDQKPIRSPTIDHHRHVWFVVDELDGRYKNGLPGGALSRVLPARPRRACQQQEHEAQSSFAQRSHDTPNSATRLPECKKFYVLSKVKFTSRDEALPRDRGTARLY